VICKSQKCCSEVAEMFLKRALSSIQTAETMVSAKEGHTPPSKCSLKLNFTSLEHFSTTFRICPWRYQKLATVVSKGEYRSLEYGSVGFNAHLYSLYCDLNSQSSLAKPRHTFWQGITSYLGAAVVASKDDNVVCWHFQLHVFFAASLCSRCRNDLFTKS
jgi:hypothetical protein